MVILSDVGWYGFYTISQSGQIAEFLAFAQLQQAVAVCQKHLNDLIHVINCIRKSARAHG